MKGIVLVPEEEAEEDDILRAYASALCVLLVPRRRCFSLYLFFV
jgi:hypothetical protein